MKKPTMQRLPIGISNFKELREENCYFIDKTLFIKEIIEDNAKIILLPRPRRFGKTLNLSMLHSFFEQTDKEKKIKKLFSGLKIKKQKVFQQHFCKHPVIFFTFKDIKSLDFKSALEKITILISDEFRRHHYLLDSLEQFEKQEFEDISWAKSGKGALEKSLYFLSSCLYKHYGKKPIVLIDEYDTPIHTAYFYGYYDEIIAFFKGFLGAGLKDNENIFKGVLTGILRVAKESIFSDMNNLGVYSLIVEEFSDKFGFTEKEVFELLKSRGIEDKFKNVRDWYDGYVFGKQKIYNPWSILKFVSSKNNELLPYWANTSSNDLIHDLIRESDRKMKREFEDLLNNIPIKKNIDENIVFKDIKKDDVTIYSFLLFSGYLKITGKKRINNKDTFTLLIPNIEVRLIFEKIITKWIGEGFKSYKLDKMLKSLLNEDIKTFEKMLSIFVIETLSYFDTAKNVEAVYQAFILGMLVDLAPEYEINSNKESGLGRYDISIIPKNKEKTAFIMELKTIDKMEKETKNTALKSALKQIEEKKYQTEIQKRGITKIEKLAVVFDGKRVWVKTAANQNKESRTSNKIKKLGSSLASLEKKSS